jgi:twitching motility protein PilJ
MSVAASLKNLFGKKDPSDADPSITQEMSLGPDASASIEAGSTQGIDRSRTDPDSVDDSIDSIEEVDQAELITVPLLGRRTTATHQRVLFTLLSFSLVVLGSVAIFAVNQADKVAQQVAGTGSSLMQSQRLAKSVSQALIGSPQAFPDVKESADVLARTVRALKSGDATLDAVGRDMQSDVEKIVPLMERAEKNAATVMNQQKILTQVGAALRTINRQSSDLLEIAETVSSLKLQQNAPPAEISAAGQLVMLTQRIGKSANEFLTMEGVSPEAVFLLART